jgi:hypothetical protein
MEHPPLSLGVQHPEKTVAADDATVDVARHGQAPFLLTLTARCEKYERAYVSR